MSDEKKIIKSHGMSSEKASRVKKRGHNKEHIFAGLINGEIIKGTKKPDVRGKHGQLYSIKGGSEIQKKEGRDGRWSIFLFSKNKFKKDKDFPASEIFTQILDCYPEKYEDYQSSKDTYKKKIIPFMIKLKEYLLDKENLSNFFNKSFFDKRVDFFVIYDDEVFHIFEKDEVWQTFLDYFEVNNSSTFQKVVFKYNKLCGEIEVRSTDDGKYPSMIFTMGKRANFNLLSEKITKTKEFTHVIKLYGKAIETFNE